VHTAVWAFLLYGESVNPLAAALDYKKLCTFLQSRYADRLVLTFAQIEDLLGFPLPAPARLEREWWSSAAAGMAPSTQSVSWASASRSATVNLGARTVLFERVVAATA
jgi:hypothetical protein